ncbi:MAG: SGNH/GDSL hydrolase family protein [Clostridia bacterium]|nr:SGNH/GDSL hydrolase family protein [Clostridia bacterium]
MKMNKTKRLIAFVLSLVMIVPLIGVPVFAADAGSVYTVYTNDFEGKTFNTDLDSDGTNDAYKMVANEDSLKDFGEGYIVKDPTGADDDVWSITTAATTGTQVTGIRPTYVDYGTVFFENDVYIPSGATGTTRWRMYGTGAYADDSGDYRYWFTFYDLNLNGAKIVMPDATEVALKKDTWFTISYALEMTTGVATLYVDGDQAYTGTLLSGGKAMKNVRMELFYNAYVDVRGVKSLYVDNINIFEGTAPSDHLKKVSIFQQNFDGKTFDTDTDGDGIKDAYKIVDSESGFRYDDDEGLNLYIEGKGTENYHYVVGDPTSNYATNGAWRVPMSEDNYGNWGHILPAMTNAAYQYSKVVVEMDLYVPTGIVSCSARWRSWAGRNPAGTAGGTHTFMDLDFASGAIKLGGQSYAISKETWHTVSLCIDFKSGVVNIYVDNVLAITHDVGDDLVIGYFWFAMPDDYGNAGSYLWVDNIDIFTGREPTGGALTEAPIAPLYSNTMEGWKFDTDLNGDTVKDAHKITDAENIGYDKNRPNSVIDTYYTENGGTATANDYHYFVQDPTGAANDVWRIPMSLANHDNWGHLIVGRDPFNYASTQKVLLENDVYISKDAVGKVNWQIYAGVFKSLYNLNLGTSTLYIDTDHHSDVSIVGNMQLKQEQWYKISYAWDLVSGDWSLYVDHVLVATGNINLTNISVIWLWNARLLETTAGFKGFLYVDNVNVWAANDLSSVYTENTTSVDASKPLQYINVTVDGKTVKTLGTKYLVPTNDATYKTTPVYFNDNGEFNSTVSNVGKVSVRYGDGTEDHPAGLRFATKIDLDLLAQLEQMVEEGTLKAVTLGTLIAPTDYIQKVDGINTVPIADSLAALTPGKTVIDLPVKDGQWYDFEDEENYPDTYFVGSIVNLKVENYGRAFSAAGYVKVTLLSGKSVYILADAHSRDVKSTSQTLLKDYGDQLTTWQKKILQNYVDGISNGSSKLEKLYGLNVLAVGDSLFGGHSLGHENQWLAILAKQYSWNLTNLGSNGWLVANNAESERPSMSDKVRNDPAFAFGSASYYNYGDTASKKPEDVDVIFVEGGYNDYNWGTPLGTLDSTDGTTFYGALNLMVSALLEQYPNATVVMHTSWHLSGSKTVAGETVDRMDYLAKAMKNIYNFTYAGNDRVVLIDAGDPNLTGVYMADAAWRAQYAYAPDDTAHLNQAGMELMANSMDNLLVNALYGTKPTRILCVGDSITAGGYWKNNLQGYLDESYDVYGLGVSGTTGLWTGVDLGFDPSGAPYSYVSKPEYALSKRYSADMVVIMLGTNDTKPENYEKITADNGAQFIADMTAMVKSYQELASAPKVFLALPATIYRDHAGGSMSNVNLEELIIPSLEAVAEATGAILIDVHGATANAGEHFSDGVHPSDDTGRALIAEAVANAILDAAKV